MKSELLILLLKENSDRESSSKFYLGTSVLSIMNWLIVIKYIAVLSQSITALFNCDEINFQSFENLVFFVWQKLFVTYLEL